MKHVLTAFALVGAMLGGAAAQAQNPGEEEYMNYCASCHGADAKGEGPLADLMTVEVPDLTTIAADNDGTFPMLEMIQVIDGRTGVRGHGYPMPVWGDRFDAEVGEEAGPYGGELVVRGRVLALATYLQSIQE
jgi:mono/diheme cytochrome c family protein